LPSSRSSPLLLASVLGPEEAGVALRGGADILDLKDPREGSLGACTPAVLRSVVRLRDAEWERGHSAADGPRRPRVSAALGDATNRPGTFALAAAGAAACGVDYLKVGLRGLRGERESRRFLAAVVRAARESAPDVGVIAAAYAEARDLGIVEPRFLPQVAQSAGAAGCLIDTAVKDGRILFDHLDAETIARFIADCRGRGLLCGLAGSLGPAQAPLLVELGPDVVGVRGAICEGGRTGRLEASRLKSFRAALDGAGGARPAAAGRRSGRAWPISRPPA
jgi:(5-formylfuran-3-yl)methyl phosphate synthase